MASTSLGPVRTWYGPRIGGRRPRFHQSRQLLETQRSQGVHGTRGRGRVNVVRGCVCRPALLSPRGWLRRRHRCRSGSPSHRRGAGTQAGASNPGPQPPAPEGRWPVPVRWLPAPDRLAPTPGRLASAPDRLAPASRLLALASALPVWASPLPAWALAERIRVPAQGARARGPEAAPARRAPGRARPPGAWRSTAGRSG